MQLNLIMYWDLYVKYKLSISFCRHYILILMKIIIKFIKTKYNITNNNMTIIHTRSNVKIHKN